MSKKVKKYYKKKTSEGWKIWVEIYHKNIFGGITNITKEELTKSMNSTVDLSNNFYTLSRGSHHRQRPFKKKEAKRMVSILNDKI